VATHDYVIANGTGAAVRSDLNGALAAIVSQNSNASAPATTYPYMLWADTTAGIMKMRNGANSAFISLWELDGTFIATDISLSAGTAAAPSLYFTGSTNTGLYSPGSGQVAISTNGTGRLFVNADGTIVVGSTSVLASPTVYSSASPTISFSDGTNVAYAGLIGIQNRLLNLSSAGTTLIQSDRDIETNVIGGYPWIVKTANAERMRLDSSGRLGLGTSSPSEKLEVVGNIRLTGNQALIFQQTSGVAVGAVSFKNSAGVQKAAIASYYNVADEGAIEFVGPTIGTNVIIRSDGKVGIGSTGPVSTLNVSVPDSGAITISNTNDSHTGALQFGDTSSNSSGRISYDHTSNAMRFDTAGSERARIDSSGRLLVGTSSSTSSKKLIVVGSSVDASSLWLGNNGGAPGSGNAFNALYFGNGTNGQDRAVRIESFQDGGFADLIGLRFFTQPSDGAGPTERMRINQAGGVSIATPSATYDSNEKLTIEGVATIRSAGATTLYVGRNTNDGTLVDFRQADVSEGSISVSGTTVSYNGAHLSRWSQLPSGAERTEILRGSVLSNIDEMCEWGDEENEQLNRMKVSDIEGDKNVSGVFQAWDDDDDTYTDDFYCAMTGDFIIRIAEGVTVARGDLLMSAGDGTAKPQDDDIIRSKTVAKVTSTNVSCTYEDGSYCVPCVLMAC